VDTLLAVCVFWRLGRIARTMRIVNLTRVRMGRVSKSRLGRIARTMVTVNLSCVVSNILFLLIWVDTSLTTTFQKNAWPLVLMIQTVKTSEIIHRECGARVLVLPMVFACIR